MKNLNSTTSWGGVADWYDEAITKEGSYQKNLILPNLLRLLNIKKKDAILDIACGQGFFAREFSKKGADVTGIDIAPELIDIAKRESSPEIKFFVSSAEKMPQIKSSSIDKIVIVLALQNIENVKGVFEECFRVLKKDGKLFLVLNHPAFRIPQHSTWRYDLQDKIQYREESKYLSEIKIPIQMHPGSTNSINSWRASSPQADAFTISFHRPLQYYFKLLASAGFCVGRMEEWESPKKSQPGPRSKAEDTARKEFPLFLYLEALKR